MTSYIPEFVYGEISGTYGQTGLTPWPAHMTPRSATTADQSSGIELTKKAEAYVAAALAEADGVFFLTIDKRDRTSIATTVERLINMLDDMEDDCDLEDGADDEPSLGRLCNGGISTSGTDDREEDCEDEGAQDDREPSHGWELGSGPYDQRSLGQGMTKVADEREEENEHGGDINDEGQDETDSGDAEPFLGWSEYQGQHGAIATGDEFSRGGGYTRFDGDGVLASRKVLRNLWCKRPDVRQTWRNFPPAYGDPDALKVDGLNIKGLKADDFRRLPWA